MKTTQEIFSQVRKHLLTQMAVSTISNGRTEQCAYRGGVGRMCAAGCLITDESYQPQIEGQLVGSPAVNDALTRSGVPVSALELVRRMQSIHDGLAPTRWMEKLNKLAEDHGLEPV